MPGLVPKINGTGDERDTKCSGVLVHSKTHEEQRYLLNQVFERLKMHNLKIRLEKCHFATTAVEYLGF